MPGLQPELTRKDTQHFPTLTIIYIPKVTLNVRTSAWVNPKGKTTFPILTVNEKLSMLYILEGLYTQYQDKQHLPAILIYEI